MLAPGKATGPRADRRDPPARSCSTFRTVHAHSPFSYCRVFREGPTFLFRTVYARPPSFICNDCSPTARDIRRGLRRPAAFGQVDCENPSTQIDESIVKLTLQQTQLVHHTFMGTFEIENVHLETPVTLLGDGNLSRGAKAILTVPLMSPQNARRADLFRIELLTENPALCILSEPFESLPVRAPVTSLRDAPPSN